MVVLCNVQCRVGSVLCCSEQALWIMSQGQWGLKVIAEVETSVGNIVFLYFDLTFCFCFTYLSFLEEEYLYLMCIGFVYLELFIHFSNDNAGRTELKLFSIGFTQQIGQSPLDLKITSCVPCQPPEAEWFHCIIDVAYCCIQSLCHFSLVGR